MMECKAKHSEAAKQLRDHRFLERRLKHASKTRGLNTQNLAQCHPLLNLVSATIARVGAKIMDEVWQPKLLADLAKVTTKLKLICAAPYASAQRSVRNSQSAAEATEPVARTGYHKFGNQDVDDSG